MTRYYALVYLYDTYPTDLRATVEESYHFGGYGKNWTSVKNTILEFDPPLSIVDRKIVAELTDANVIHLKLLYGAEFEDYLIDPT